MTRAVDGRRHRTWVATTSVFVSSPRLGKRQSEHVPPRRPHYYGFNHLHYLTANIYRHARIFDSDRFKLKFVQTLGDLREELGFKSSVTC